MDRRKVMGDNLKVLCRRTGKSHAQIARELGINTAKLHNYKIGRATPSLDLLCAILEYFGTNFEDLMTEGGV